MASQAATKQLPPRQLRKCSSSIHRHRLPDLALRPLTSASDRIRLCKAMQTARCRPPQLLLRQSARPLELVRQSLSVDWASTSRLVPTACHRLVPSPTSATRKISQQHHLLRHLRLRSHSLLQGEPGAGRLASQMIHRSTRPDAEDGRGTKPQSGRHWATAAKVPGPARPLQPDWDLTISLLPLRHPVHRRAIGRAHRHRRGVTMHQPASTRATTQRCSLQVPLARSQLSTTTRTPNPIRSSTCAMCRTGAVAASRCGEVEVFVASSWFLSCRGPTGRLAICTTSVNI